MRIRFVDVIPRVLTRFFTNRTELIRCERQKLLDHRNLLHRIDKLRVSKINGIDLTLSIRIQLDADGTEQFFQIRTITELYDLTHHFETEVTAESDSLAADSSHHEVFTLLVKFLRLMKHEALNVGVERARQTLIRSDNDDCRRTGLFLVLDEEGMRVAARRSRQVRNDIANLVSVRTSLTHPILCLAHLRGRNHFHRLGDLARVLHALDLSANFLCTRHVVLSN